MLGVELRKLSTFAGCKNTERRCSKRHTSPKLLVRLVCVQLLLKGLQIKSKEAKMSMMCEKSLDVEPLGCTNVETF